ncbi:GNAT family N-acetyltransferase [Kangiella spongicola]|uniref:GNAT family N-acetyltransferase n=1 Tax=Kangiella spongicola TaxID=796379 RepID=A0A318D0M3_9GAMM|nr:GNAT family N-acetyltransferase [Kangiella spongicola]PXF62772.1 GNAT family N-acetyltransferase [Kangiella spongicola]
MSDIKISKELNGDKGGRYVARIDSREGEGEITFTIRDEQVISADHTGVPESMSGQGIAKALLNFMLEDAKKENFKIIPICPFVRAQYARHPEWSDLFTTEPGETPKL